MAWKVLCIVLLSLACEISEANGKVNYRGAKVFNVFSADQHLLHKFTEKAGLDVWFQNSTNTKFLVRPKQLKIVQNFLNSKDIDYTVDIQDVQKGIDEERSSMRMNTRGGFNLENYHRLSEIYSWMDNLKSKYPNRVSIDIVGYSYEKRPIKCIKISSGVPGAKIAFIDGGIHAREWVSTATALYIINEVVENRSKLPAYMQTMDFYVLPVVNPDGYEFTFTGDRLWRKNRSKNPSGCIGTDLNRNFDAHFGGAGTSGNGCVETYRGTHAFSEPETKAYSEYINKVYKEKNFVAFIAFHSYSQYILLPYAYADGAYPPDFKELKAVGLKAAEAIKRFGGEEYEVGTPPEILYAAAGGIYDWVKEKVGVKYCYTYELRDTGKYGFTLPARYIKPTAQEAFEGVKVMLEAAARK